MAASLHDLFGTGLITPFRRLAGVDFESATGEVLVRAAIRQVLMTEKGELPWRPSFGAGLEHFRHKASPILEQEIEAACLSAIQRNEPRARVVGLKAEQQDERLTVHIAWALVTPSNQNQVIAGPFETEVTV